MASDIYPNAMFLPGSAKEFTFDRKPFTRTVNPSEKGKRSGP
jgi:hypothetical protein